MSAHDLKPELVLTSFSLQANTKRVFSMALLSKDLEVLDHMCTLNCLCCTAGECYVLKTKLQVGNVL